MKFLYYLLSIFILTSCSPASTSTKQNNQQPNIIFILTDDLGWGDLGAFYQNQRAEAGDRQHSWHKTPHLDKMAEDGVMLTDHYCNAPVCAPSRASFLLGVHQGHSNVRDNQFDKALEDNYTVANVLKEAGYETVAVGKWGLQGATKYSEDGDEWLGHPMNRGFDEFYGYMRHRDGHEHYPVEGIYRGEKEVWHNRENVAAGLAKCYTGDLWTAFAKKWIMDHQKENDKKPFFMFLAYDTPHAVIEIPTQEYPSGSGVNGGLQWIGEPGHMINTASGEVDSWIHPDYDDATWDDDRNPSTDEVAWPDTYKRFATVNRRIDDAVGDVRQLLKDLDIDDNTLVVFTSDNGPSRESYLPEEYAVFTPEFFRSYGPFDGIKRDVLEGGVRTPAIVTWPENVPQGKVTGAPVMMSDWMATFCDAAGVVPPERSDGESLLPVLRGDQSLNNPVYIEYAQGGKTPNYDDFLPAHRERKRGQMQLIRFDDLVGVRYDIQSQQDDFEIYDVVNDPQQGNNLAGEAQYEELQEKMKKMVLQMRIPNPSAERPYDSELVPSISEAGINLNNGLMVTRYDVYSKWIPQIENIEALHHQVFNNLSTVTDGLGNMILLEGFIRVPENGIYTFQIESSNQVILRIHETLVIDGDYPSEESMKKEGNIRLAKGLHPIRLYIKKNSGNPLVYIVKWKTEGISEYEHIPGEYLYH